MKNLKLIYRVCDGVNVCSAHSRCFAVSKNKLIKKCLESLKVNVQSLPKDINLEMICVYDHCSEDMVSFIRSNFPEAKMVPLEEPGGNARSFCKCVEIATGFSDDDIVYFLEDDYLFLSTSVLTNIVNNLLDLSEAEGRHCAMMPDDYPDRYINGEITTKCRVTRTGHFLRIGSTTCTFVTFGDVIRKYENDLMAFIRWPMVGENESVNKLWKETPLFQPIPAYTLHSQLVSVIPPYLNFEKLKHYFES